MGFGGGSGGGGNIGSATDVALNNPSNNQVLTYDGSVGKWKNVASQSAPVSSVAGKTGAVTLAKADVGLDNIDNTSDVSKPVSAAVQTALDGKETAGAVAAHEAASDPHPTASYAIMVGGGRRVFVQSTDPGGAASDGDLWIDTA